MVVRFQFESRASIKYKAKCDIIMINLVNFVSSYTKLKSESNVLSCSIIKNIDTLIQ